ncbi:sulfatase-like hydrolase/transferase, partial [Salmonella enterica]
PITNYQIPLFIYAPKLIDARESAQLASQIDLAPTLLGLINLSYESTFFGRDLLQDNPLPPRVVVGNYQHLGLFDGKNLAILSPRQG